MKAILFDIDGVLIHYPCYFSSTLSTEVYSEPKKNLDSFYKSELNRACDRGEKNPYIEIKPFLEKMGWKETCESYLEEQWKYEIALVDWDLLKTIENLKQQGILLCIASCQNKIRKAYLEEKMGLKEIFDKLYFSCEIGYLKEEDEYWEYVIIDLKKNGVNKNEMTFFNDIRENIEKAEKFGIKGIEIRNRNEIWELVKQMNITTTA